MTSSRCRKEEALEERAPEDRVWKEKDIKNKACPATSYVEGMPFLYLGGGEASLFYSDFLFRSGTERSREFRPRYDSRLPESYPSHFSLFRKKWGESPHLPQPTLSPTEAMRWVRLSR